MKMHKRTLAAVVLGLALAALTPAQPDAAQAALKSATDKEMVDGDLKSAIALYGKVAATYKANKAVAAQALYRLGQCHEKLGQADASKAYEQLVRQYGDQKEAASARARLAALRGSSPLGPSARLAWTMTYSYNLGNASSDGRYHAYISGPEGGLILRDLQSGETRAVPGAEKGENPYEAVLSPDGEWIAYGAQPNWGLQELRVIPAAGGTPRTVFKTGPGVDVGWVVPMGWTPDNKSVLVVFNTPVASLYHVGLIQVDTGELRILKKFDYGFYRWASLSPDGKWVAYNVQTSPENVECDIHVIRADGSGERKLIDHPSDDVDPHWSGDGRGLVWRSNRRGTVDAYFVPVKDGQAAGNPVLVKTDIPMDLKGVSRSGTLFYEAEGGTHDLFVLSLDSSSGAARGTPERLPLAYSGWKLSPVVSPDGESVAYVRPSMTTPRVSYIVIRSLRTGQEREVHPKVKNLRSIAWTADGKSMSLLARNMRDVHTQYLMDLASGALKAVLDKQIHTEYNLGFTAASYDPGGTTFYPPTWNDGKTSLLVAVQTDTLQARTLHRMPATNFSRPWVSPDGRFVAATFSGTQDSKRGLLVVNARSGEVHFQLETAERLSLNGWTPDGRSVVVYAASGNASTSTEVWRIAIDSGSIVKSLLPSPFVFPRASAPQANGNFLVQSIGQSPHQIWAVDNCLPKK